MMDLEGVLKMYCFSADTGFLTILLDNLGIPPGARDAVLCPARHSPAGHPGRRAVMLGPRAASEDAWTLPEKAVDNPMLSQGTEQLAPLVYGAPRSISSSPKLFPF